MELRRTETGFALYKEKEAIGHCTLHPAAQGAALAALAIDPAWLPTTSLRLSTMT